MKLAKTNNLPLDQFINLALYDKDKGYYMKKNPFGEDGDFITAPNITRLFSEIIAIWVLTFWKSIRSIAGRITQTLSTQPSFPK